MARDVLTDLPLEILQEIIRHLDSLDFLRCRQINSKLKCCLKSLPEYRIYEETHNRVMKIYYKDTRKRGVWQPAGIRRFVDLMRSENPPSDTRMLMVLKCYLARETVWLVEAGS